VSERKGRLTREGQPRIYRRAGLSIRQMIRSASGPGLVAQHNRGLVFADGSQAACANLHGAAFALSEEGNLLDVGFPLPLGLDVRMADIVSKRWALATDFAFCHGSFTPTQIRPAKASAGHSWSGSWMI
jgi:hypothetical protein